MVWEEDRSQSLSYEYEENGLWQKNSFDGERERIWGLKPFKRKKCEKIVRRSKEKKGRIDLDFDIDERR